MRDRLAAICLLICLGLVPWGGGRAVPVEGLYEATVAGDSTEAGRAPAALEALRVVIVRLTGKAASATDQHLQGLLGDAPKYVQTYRSLAPGQIAVAFDPALLEAALAKTGRRLWGRERPQILVILDGPAAAQAVARHDLQAAGQFRGLPLAFADTRVEPPAGVREGNPDALRAVAKTFAADGVLLLHLSALPAGVWTGPAGDGEAFGTPGEILDVLADRLGGALAVNASDTGRLLVVVRGVNDLPAFVAVLSQLGGLPAVQSVTVDSVNASTLSLRVAGGVDAAVLRKSLRDVGHFEVIEGGGVREVDLVYHP